MRVIESFILGKEKDQKLCEDGFIVTEDFAAVVDGCTTRSAINYDGKSPGRVAQEVVINAIKSLNPNATALEAAQYLDTNITAWYKKKGIYDLVKNNPQARCSCYYAIYSQVRREIWVLGDCQALVNGHLITYEKFIDKLHGLFRSFIIRSKLIQGVSEKTLLKQQQELRVIAKAISDYQPIFQNTGDELFGFSVLDGFFRPSEMLRVESVPAFVEEVILATDGYPVVADNLADTEEKLNQINKEDPLCYKKNISTKGVMPNNNSFDDRTYLRVDIK